jgi:hypothetical protein
MEVHDNSREFLGRPGRSGDEVSASPFLFRLRNREYLLGRRKRPVGRRVAVVMLPGLMIVCLLLLALGLAFMAYPVDHGPDRSWLWGGALGALCDVAWGVLIWAELRKRRAVRLHGLSEASRTRWVVTDVLYLASLVLLPFGLGIASHAIGEPAFEFALGTLFASWSGVGIVALARRGRAMIQRDRRGHAHDGQLLEVVAQVVHRDRDRDRPERPPLFRMTVRFDYVSPSGRMRCGGMRSLVFGHETAPAPGTPVKLLLEGESNYELL